MSFVERSGRSAWRVRYWRDDGTHASISGFPTRRAAEAKAREIDTDRRRGEFLDPHAGRITLDTWITTWFDAIDVAPATTSQYRSITRNHIRPRWGTTTLGEISGIAVAAWAKTLRAEGYAAATVATILKIFSMMLADAADERLIPANPIRPRRRGRRRHEPVTEPVWATPPQALRVAVNAARLAGPTAGILLLTAGWTGARWGELTGLHRNNLHLDRDGTGAIVIDPRVGALHEVDNTLYLGPPKTAESARTVALPPFLVDVLRHHLATHAHPHVFVNPDGSYLRRSNFARRAMRPAADGTPPRAPVAAAPAAPGLTFHGLRHSHKTWLIADHVPEVAQARRLGHRIPDKIQHIYSHVAPELEARVLDALQNRWTAALAELAAPSWASAVVTRPALPALVGLERRPSA